MMGNENFPLETGEEMLGTWTLNYIPSSGKRYLGGLSITNKRLMFTARFDISSIVKSSAGLVSTAAFAGALGLDQAWVKCEEELVSFEIPKSSITSVVPKKGFFSKSVKVVLNNGSEHIFHYGMMSINKLLSAIQTG